jgi:cytochrome c5
MFSANYVKNSELNMYFCSMKQIIFIISLLLSTIIFYQCASNKTVLSPPSHAELAAAQQRWPDATLESLISGQTIYTTKCNTCHGLKKIPGRTEASWDKEINRMAPKAKITEAEKEKLKRYIFATLDVSNQQVK